MVAMFAEPADSQMDQPADLDWYSGADEILNQEDGVERIEVLGPNRRRLAIEKDWAIKTLLKSYDDERQAEKRLDLLLETLARWISQQMGIRSAHITHIDGRFKLLVEQEQETYDEALHERLTELWIRVGRDPHLRQINFDTAFVGPMTRDGVRSFVNPEFHLVYSAIRTGASTTE